MVADSHSGRLYRLVKNSRLKGIATTTRDTVYASPDYTSIHMDGKVNLVWHQINYAEMNSEFASDTEAVTGVNVISPTWYFLQNNEGDIESFADASYVEAAHAKGCRCGHLSVISAKR